MWRHPFGEGATPAAARRKLEEELSRLGLALTSEESCGTARHAMVNRQFWIRIYPAGVSRSTVRRKPSEGVRWFRPSELARAAVPTLTRKAAAAAGFLRS